MGRHTNCESKIQEGFSWQRITAIQTTLTKMQIQRTVLIRLMQTHRARTRMLTRTAVMQVQTHQTARTAEEIRMLLTSLTVTRITG